MTNTRMEHEAGIPDPTTITTAQLLREISATREILTAEFRGDKAQILARLDAIDRATSLFETNLSRVPTDTDKQVEHLKALMESELTTAQTKFETMFDGVSKQFAERDTRTTQSEVASKEAIAAALQAAKEAVGEQAKNFALLIDRLEASITKQIDAIKQQGDTAMAGVTREINDIKDRTTRIESLGIGAATQKGETRDTTSMIFMVIGSMIGISGVALAIVTLATR